MGGVGAIVTTIAVAFADNELGGGEFGELGLDRAQREAAASGDVAQMELG